MVMTPPDNSNEPKANSMEEALRKAESTSKSWPSSYDPRGNPDGVLFRFGAENAGPEAKGFRQLNKLRDRIKDILNNVSVSIGGQPMLGTKREACEPYDDFFEKGHREEFRLGYATLAIEVKFTVPGSLKLIIKNLTAEQTPNQLQQGDGGFTLDRLVNLHYNPQRSSLNDSYDIATLPGGEYFMTAIFEPLAMFADANRLALYVQAMRTDRLIYTFLDQDPADYV